MVNPTTLAGLIDEHANALASQVRAHYLWTAQLGRKSAAAFKTANVAVTNPFGLTIIIGMQTNEPQEGGSNPVTRKWATLTINGVQDPTLRAQVTAILSALETYGVFSISGSTVTFGYKIETTDHAEAVTKALNAANRR
ncbi:MAG TPA: hypothetical protein VLA77_04245 [Candidatus Saccharimonadales bacterium]|nr:hypothetical protein [Candidatus Saccharimonadales bacterium]